MTLTLEINGSPVINMFPENNKEVYAITEAWMKLLEQLGIKDFLIYKTFKSTLNHDLNTEYLSEENISILF